MAFAAGFSRDALATYLPAFLVAGALYIVAATSFYLLRNRRGRRRLRPLRNRTRAVAEDSERVAQNAF